MNVDVRPGDADLAASVTKRTNRLEHPESRARYTGCKVRVRPPTGFNAGGKTGAVPREVSEFGRDTRESHRAPRATGR